MLTLTLVPLEVSAHVRWNVSANMRRFCQSKSFQPISLVRRFDTALALIVIDGEQRNAINSTPDCARISLTLRHTKKDRFLIWQGR